MARNRRDYEEAVERLWKAHIRTALPSDFANIQNDQQLTTYIRDKVWGGGRGRKGPRTFYSQFSPLMDFMVEYARNQTKVVTDKRTGASQTKPLLDYYDLHGAQRAARIQQTLAESSFKEQATKGLKGYVKTQRKLNAIRKAQLRQAEEARVRSTIKAVKRGQPTRAAPVVRGQPTIIPRRKGFAAQLDVIKRQRATEKAAITRQLNPKQHIPTETKRPIVSAKYYAQHSKKVSPVVTNTLPTTKRMKLPNVEHKSRRKALSQFKR
jgi:hypothetical protein